MTTHVIKVDAVGRTTLPKEVRKALASKNVACTIDGDTVTLKPIPDLDRCIFCGGDPEQEYKGKWICQKCLDNIPQN